MSRHRGEDKVIMKSVFKDKLGNMTGQLHSCISMDITNHLFLVDEQHFYKYILAKENKKGELKKYEN